MDDLRRVERQLQGDDATGGVADDVGALDAQVPQQRPAIGGLLGDAERRRHARAAGVAAPVVAHQPVVGRSAGSAQSGAYASAMSAPWMSTTGSPVPTISYSKTPPSTLSCCFVPVRSSSVSLHRSWAPGSC